MKVRVRDTVSRAGYPDLTPGNVHHVIGIEADDFRIMSDEGQPYLYPAILFEIVDPDDSPDWMSSVGTGGERYAYPRELNTAGFFEDYFNGERKPAVALKLYMAKLTGRTK